MPNNKGLLSKEEICKAIGCTIACKPKGLPVGDCPFDDKRGCTIYQAGSMAIEAQLSALSSQPDEELVKEITHYLTDQFIGQAEDYPDDECLSEIKDILSHIAPIMAARVEEAKKEGYEDGYSAAVIGRKSQLHGIEKMKVLSSQPDERLVEIVSEGLNNKLPKVLIKAILDLITPKIEAMVEEAYYKGLNKQIDLKLEQARVEERKAIGKYLANSLVEHRHENSKATARALSNSFIEALCKGEQPLSEE